MKLITAIYDKKAKTLGRPIYQDNIEKAISGVKDALNSMNTNGEYLMPAHREHPEDFCLMQLGYLNESAKEETQFNPETGEYKIVEKNEPFIIPEEKIIIEFKDIELKEMQQKISAESVYNMLNQIKEEMSTSIYESMLKSLTDWFRAEDIKEKPTKRSFWSWKK